MYHHFMNTGKYKIQIRFHQLRKTSRHSRKKNCSCTIGAFFRAETVSCNSFIWLISFQKVHKIISCIGFIKQHFFPVVDSGRTDKIGVYKSRLKNGIRIFSPLFWKMFLNFRAQDIAVFFTCQIIQNQCNISDLMINRVF